MNEEGGMLFDWRLWGALLRNGRRRLGYKKAVDFAKAVRDRTGLDISQETIYKIEQGKRVPSAMQLMAVLLMFDPVNARKWEDLCMCGEWRGIRGE